LISNAIKYSGKRDHPTVTILAESTKAEIIFQIVDNGVGFDMHYADKLFGVFQRLHGGDEYPGTGIGLAVVRRIVARHGGRVWAQSVLGNGTTFFFALPSVTAS
jgi:light-regulated signal transduction histidine kinase (bacteriophytochrome)